jgi:hypothetical protein
MQSKPSSDEFDRCVRLLYPYLSGSESVKGKAQNHLIEVLDAAEYLDVNFHNSRGSTFEMLRSLSIDDARRSRRDARDSLATKLVAKVLFGRGDDEGSVESFVYEGLGLIREASIHELCDLVTSEGNTYLTGQEQALSLANWIVEFLLNGARLESCTEKDFEQRFDGCKSSFRTSLSQPGLIGNLVVSNGGGIKEAAKADARAKKRKYSKDDVILLAACAETLLPTLDTVRKFQRAMGWALDSWDPRVEVQNLRRR